MPSLIMLFILLAALIYFRYFVASPFAVGKGQSWSQFKLAEWAHPFLALLVAFCASLVLVNLGQKHLRLLLLLLAIVALSSVYISLQRIRPIINYYENSSDLGSFYREFRRVVFSRCSLGSPVYLELTGNDYKFRHMAALFLADRVVKADWKGDDYIGNSMPEGKVSLFPKKGDCLVKPNDNEVFKTPWAAIGHLRVGQYDGGTRVRLASVEGGYGREVDGKRWWHWVERQLSFGFNQSDELNGDLIVQFDYATRPDAPIRVQVFDKAEGSRVLLQIDLQDQQGSFSRVVALNQVRELAVVIDTIGKARPLGDADTRIAAFRVENFSVQFEGR